MKVWKATKKMWKSHHHFSDAFFRHFSPRLKVAHFFILGQFDEVIHIQRTGAPIKVMIFQHKIFDKTQIHTKFKPGSVCLPFSLLDVLLLSPEISKIYSS